MMNRRSFLASSLAAPAFAQRDWSGKDAYPLSRPDIVVLDKRFAKIQDRATPPSSACTPACAGRKAGLERRRPISGLERYPQQPADALAARRTATSASFRTPLAYSNGNTFDYEGRQLSCEHGTRRVVRYEHNGSVTVLADKWQGKPLNAPNDIVVHPDGGIWFTDPGYGILVEYEGATATRWRSRRRSTASTARPAR